MRTTRKDDDEPRSLINIPDSALPDWLHTTLIFLVATPFALPSLYDGVIALFSRRLEPLFGPDFGTWMFGPDALVGRAAVFGGWSLITFGLSVYAGMAACTRFGSFTDARKYRFLALAAVLMILSTLTGAKAVHLPVQKDQPRLITMEGTGIQF